VKLNGTFCGDGTRFATLTNNVLSVWNTIPTTLISTCSLAAPANSVVLNYNGTFVLTISTNSANPSAVGSSISVFAATTGHQIGPAILLTNAPAGVVFARDGSHFVAYWNRFAQTYSASEEKTSSLLLDHQARVDGVAISSDGSRVATFGNSLVRIWDASSGSALCPALKHDRRVQDAAFSPDGSLLVSACSDSFVNKCAAQIWDVATGNPLGKPLAHRDGVLRAIFSMDGRRLATASEDFTAILWDVRTGKRISPVLHHKDQVHGVSFSPDGDCVATASQDYTARIWSADSGDPLTPPLLHLSRLENVVFLPDGKKVLTSDQLGSSWLWDLPVDDRPVEDLMLLSYLLSGGTATPSSGWTPPHGASLQSIWEDLNRRYPSEFSASPEEVTTWHEFETQLAKRQGNWGAVVFHLNFLRKNRPDDASLNAQLEEANQHLQNQLNPGSTPRPDK
jgi:WD40 repeat protein